MPAVMDKIATSLEGASRDSLRTFWDVLHKIESNLALMANGGTIVDRSLCDGAPDCTRGPAAPRASTPSAVLARVRALDARANGGPVANAGT